MPPSHQALNVRISALGFASSTWELSEVLPLVREAIEIFGPTRCLFGSSFPVERPAVSYAGIWSAYDTATSELTECERTAVFSDTASGIYRIEHPR